MKPSVVTSSVVFNHGKESGPWGGKIQSLAEVARRRGLSVESVDYQGMDNADARVAKLLSVERPLGQLLVGSSMGGYVATVASATLQPAGLFLMAPAFFLPGYGEQNPIPHARVVSVVHGWNDAVVPIESSLRFAKRYGATLHAIDDDHRLSARMPELCGLFEQFLDLALNR